jgi:hypothetical protein
MDGRRSARVGFVGIALSVLGHVAVQLWIRSALDEPSAELRLFEWVGYVDHALAAIEIVSWLLVARLAVVRTPAVLAAVASALTTLLALALPLFVRHVVGVDDLETVWRLYAIGRAALTCGYVVAFAFVGWRLARAASVRWLGGLSAVVALASLSPAVIGLARDRDLAEPSALLLAVAFACIAPGAILALSLAWAVGKLPYEAPELVANAALAPGWKKVAIGLWLYLAAGAARVVVMLVTWTTLQGAAQAESYGDLGRVSGSLLGLAVLGAIVGVVGLVAIVLCGLRPAASTTLTLVAVVLGMALDGVTTKMTLGAFESVSAAFRAQDALPWLAVVSTGLAITAGASFLAALSDTATKLERPDLADGGRSLSVALVVAGVGAAVVQLAVAHVPASIAIALAVLIVPVLLYVAVRFVILVVSLASDIGRRT